MESHEKSRARRTTEEPITVSIARKVRSGFEKEFEDWENGIIKEASTFPGYLGTSVLRPSAKTKYEYITIYRFDSYINAQNWEFSQERQKWLAKVTPFIEGDTDVKKITGLEVWFDLPDIEVTKNAPRYKMAIVLIVVLYIMVMTLNVILKPVLDYLPWPVSLLTVIVLNVLLMTYFIMPKVTKLLKHWLYKG